MTDIQIAAAKTGIMGLVNKRMTKKIKFLGTDIEIAKLTVQEVMEIQAGATAAETAEDKTDSGLDTLRSVIRISVTDAKNLSDEDFMGWPMDDLSELVNQIMKYSGIGASAEGKAP
jgi:hypothetical protein